MREFLTLLIPLGIVLFAAFCVLFCFNWTMGPLYRAARHRRDTGQFTIADLLCLFVLVQITVGVVHTVAGYGNGVIAADVVLLAIIAMLWWSCVRTLNRAGVRPTRQRCVVIVVVLPTSAIASFSFVFFAFIVLAVLSEPTRGSMTALAWYLLGITLIAGAVYAAGRFTRKITGPVKMD
jgi:hypothetical protein